MHMPRVLNAVTLAAPDVRLRSVSLPQAELQRALSEGRVDLALGYFPDLLASEFVRRKIGQHGFVCICSSDNKRVIEGFNLRKYSEARHVVVDAPGRKQGLLERYVQQRGIERRIALTTPTSCACRRSSPARKWWRLFETHLHWSKSVHDDPASKWLRAVLFGAL